MSAHNIKGKRPAQPPEPYPRGRILSSPEAEAQKSTQGRRMVRQRILALGKDSVFNMTGLVRAFPLDPEDLPSLENQFTYYAHFLGRAEELALAHVGADPRLHSAVMCNRVTSAMLAIMLGVLKPGDGVISVVGRGRSHPSAQQAVELAGGVFAEAVGLEALEEGIDSRRWRMLVITPLTPSKHHMPASEVAQAIAMAKERDMLVLVDDAHMMSRTVFYDEPVTFALADPDLTVWSLDKHVPGPRGAAIVGRRDIMDKVSAMAFQFGLEAQSGHYAAMVRGMEAYDREPVRRAASLARHLFKRFSKRFGQGVYQAGPGVALTAEDFAEAVFLRRGSRDTTLVPSEISVTGCFLLFKDYGIITIPITGYPGAAPTFRLMTHPDGERFGVTALEEAVEDVLVRTGELLERPDAVRELLLGEGQPPAR